MIDPTDVALALSAALTSPDPPPCVLTAPDTLRAVSEAIVGRSWPRDDRHPLTIHVIPGFPPDTIALLTPINDDPRRSQ